MRIMGQGQNGARFGLHDNGHSGTGRIFIHAFLQAAFRNKLDIAVDGEDEVVAAGQRDLV